MSAQHPMSATLREVANDERERHMIEQRFLEAAAALDAMQARCDELWAAVGLASSLAQNDMFGQDIGVVYQRIIDAEAAERAHREQEPSPPDPEDTRPCDPIADQRMDAADVKGGR